MKKLIQIIFIITLSFTMCACRQNNENVSSKIKKNEEGDIIYTDDEKTVVCWRRDIKDGYHYNLILNTDYIEKNYNMSFKDKEFYNILIKKDDLVIFDEQRKCGIYNEGTSSFSNIFVKKEVEEKIETNSYSLSISNDQTSIEMNFKMS